MLSHDTQAIKADLEGRAGYELSDNQVAFCRDAKEQGHEIDWHYSGRGMYGRECPAVRVDNVADFNTEADYSSDQLGLGMVVYART